MRFLLLFLTLLLQFNVSGYNAYNLKENNLQKTLTSENQKFNTCNDRHFRFQGQYEDVETGLYYNRFRYYDPSTGNYISQDPIGLEGGLGLYVYVYDPNSWVDEFGLSGKYAPTNVLGRKVYQNTTDFITGTPDIVDASVHPSIRAKIEGGATNLDLMRAGNAPIGIDGKHINLHHVLGQEPGPMVEILDSTHQKYKKPLHGLIENGRSFRNNPKLEKSYSKFKRDYWKERAKQIEAKKSKPKMSCH